MSVINEERVSEIERNYLVLSGSAGKSYQVTIKNRPYCTCPDNLGGKSGCHCKHIVSFSPSFLDSYTRF